MNAGAVSASGASVSRWHWKDAESDLILLLWQELIAENSTTALSKLLHSDDTQENREHVKAIMLGAAENVLKDYVSKAKLSPLRFVGGLDSLDVVMYERSYLPE